LLPPPAPDKVEIINIDIVYPERNWEVKVIQFRDAEMNGILHNGFEISMEGDLQDLMKDKYKAQLVRDHDILISMPSSSHYWLHEPKEYFDQVTAFGIDCPCTKEAHDVAQNAILSDKNCHVKLLLLYFPEQMALSNHHCSPNAGDHELEFKVVPFTSTFGLLGKKFNMTPVTISLKIAVFEEKWHVAREDDKGKKGEAKLSARFASMST
jgi:hypothetical protein